VNLVFISDIKTVHFFCTKKQFQDTGLDKSIMPLDLVSSVLSQEIV